ncbi:MAG: 4a-hydroxytetrahydrobiopterin dehydratase [Balneolales bacterium]|nr:4a-hydroxytetrahydrobiopterin dehydratase [Balneolales bacterium]
MSANVLSESEINEVLSELTDWEFDDNALRLELSFEDFKSAISFIVRLSYEAEDLGHHPEIQNVYSNVVIRLCTHDAGDKVTQLDVELARRIDNFTK